MGKRILAGVLGGIAMFIWSSLAHTVLSLGMTGIKTIPNEQAVLTALQERLGQSHGMYMYPSMDSASEQEYEKKLAANPSGLLIYAPPGEKGITPGRLITEFLTELIEALLAVFLMAQARPASFAGRAGFVTLIGIIASITTNISYWNWYGFPADYTRTYLFIEIVAYLCAGLVAAAILKNPAGSAAAA